MNRIQKLKHLLCGFQQNDYAQAHFSGKKHIKYCCGVNLNFFALFELVHTKSVARKQILKKNERRSKPRIKEGYEIE